MSKKPPKFSWTQMYQEIRKTHDSELPPPRRVGRPRKLIKRERTIFFLTPSEFQIFEELKTILKNYLDPKTGTGEIMGILLRMLMGRIKELDLKEVNNLEDFVKSFTES